MRKKGARGKCCYTRCAVVNGLEFLFLFALNKTMLFKSIERIKNFFLSFTIMAIIKIDLLL